MVHYIKFLKPATLNTDGERSTVSTVVTLTNDLGDSFYAEDIDIEVILKEDRGHGFDLKSRSLMAWRTGMRALKINTHLSNAQVPCSYVLEIAPAGAKHTKVTTRVNGDIALPILLGIQSAPIRVREGSRQAEKIQLRTPDIVGSRKLHIWEETGDSIARHSWDAGIGLTTVLTQVVSGSNKLPSLQSAFAKYEHGLFRVLELGTGTGLVGIAFSLLMPHIQILLTDMDENRDLIQKNIEANLCRGIHEARFAPLDWDESMSKCISDQRFDLIVGADITYNPDSSNALVRTISKVENSSGGALILVAMKERHAAERVFFESMKSQNFEIIDHLRVAAPYSLHNEDEDDSDIEHIQVYTFQRLTGKPGTTHG